MEKHKKTEQYKKVIKRLSQKIEKKSQISYVASDPTRLKILFVLQACDKICTSELAKILGVSVSAVSHQKNILERFGLIESDREGKKICCYIKSSKLTQEILKGIK